MFIVYSYDILSEWARQLSYVFNIPSATSLLVTRVSIACFSIYLCASGSLMLKCENSIYFARSTTGYGYARDQKRGRGGNIENI